MAAPKSQTLAEALSKKIGGEVRFDDGTRALYTTDASNYRQVPIGVVIPKNREDVVEAVRICREFGAPVLSRGGGTSIAGQCCNVAVVFDFSKHLNQIHEIDPIKRIARVEPGVVLDQLNAAAASYQLQFAPDPATHSRCTLGGMIGNNSCGVHSVAWGKTVENIAELEVLTYDGHILRVGKTPPEILEEAKADTGRRSEIYTGLLDLRTRYAELIRKRFPKIPRRVSGYNLDQLLPENGFDVARSLVGTEGTCVLLLEAVVNLVPVKPFKSLFVLGYPDLLALADHIPRILEFKPCGVEGLNDIFIRNMKIRGMHSEEIRLLPDGGAWLLVEFEGESGEAVAMKARRFTEEIKKENPEAALRLFTDPDQMKAIWSVRESSFGASMFVPGKKDTFSGWEDAAVAPEKLGYYFRKLQILLDEFGYEAISYGHFGDGCIHSRISFDLRTPGGIRQYRRFVERASDLVVECGGSFSGEHGDGQATAELLPKMFGEELVQAFREFKTLWDPENKMNPGKVVNPYPLDSHLRTIPYDPVPSPKLHFQFTEDHGDFSQTAARCIGIGKCRQMDHGLMCPSFQVTQEEKDSPRGRAHALQEMLRGEVIHGGWRSRAVKETLDLCLACKGCKGECPTQVDIATYKAEFLSHYYKKRVRPLSHFVFGYIHNWARLGSVAPGLANLFGATPYLGYLLKLLFGISPLRKLPHLGSQTFKHWFRMRKTPERRQKVLLWPDTFTNFFYPEVAKSAVNVLETFGFEVLVPKADLCCGRPFYDFGMLAQAKNYLGKILVALEPYLIRGIPVIGLEPSCIAVFKDELPNLFPRNASAQQLSRNAFLLGEFLENQEDKINFPKWKKKVLVQPHCHHKSLGGFQMDATLMRRIGLEAQTLDAGCCGMAGAFGFEKDHYSVSQQIGELVLLPAVRKADKDTLILADGFSCREQIAQSTKRRALHLAEVIQMALHQP